MSRDDAAAAVGADEQEAKLSGDDASSSSLPPMIPDVADSDDGSDEKAAVGEDDADNNDAAAPRLVVQPDRSRRQRSGADDNDTAALGCGFFCRRTLGLVMVSGGSVTAGYFGLMALWRYQNYLPKDQPQYTIDMALSGGASLVTLLGALARSVHPKRVHRAHNCLAHMITFGALVFALAAGASGSLFQFTPCPGGPNIPMPPGNSTAPSSSSSDCDLHHDKTFEMLGIIFSAGLVVLMHALDFALQCADTNREQGARGEAAPLMQNA